MLRTLGIHRVSLFNLHKDITINSQCSISIFSLIFNKIIKIEQIYIKKKRLIDLFKQLNFNVFSWKQLEIEELF